MFLASDLVPAGTTLVTPGLVETSLLHLFTHPQHSELVFYTLCYYFEVNIVAEQKQAYW